MTIAVFLFLLTALAYLLAALAVTARRRKRARLQSSFREAASRHGVRSDAVEFFGNRMLGLDTAGRQLIYLRDKGGEPAALVVPLQAYNRFRFHRRYRPRASGRRSGEQVSGIELELLGDNESLLIPFFHHGLDPQRESKVAELRAKRWEALLQPLLNRA